VVPAYRAPRPIHIDTADIDVTTPRNRTDRISRNRDDIQQGTIKRGRTVVRLHTKKLKENPGLVQNKRKTPGEKLVEKFLIRDKTAEKVKVRELKEKADLLKLAHTGSASLEAENGHSVASGRGSGFIISEEVEGVLARKQVAEDEEQDVVKMSQSGALSILLSKTEDEAALISNAPEPLPQPEHSPSVKCVPLKSKESKSNTLNKRPKKRDKDCATKGASDVIKAPVEKSLLQRRNTLKRLRRNSQDVELIPLDVSDHENSTTSIHADPLPLSATSVTSTLTVSTTSPLVDSAPSTAITPPVGYLSNKETRNSAVPKPECLNGSLYPFKTEISDDRSDRNISKKVSVDVSVENSDDIFKKMPLRFVVDEIKVEEIPKSPKSPKLFRYEVTVDEVADKDESFQKQMCRTMASDTPSVVNDVSSTVESMYQVDVENSNNEKGVSKGTATTALNVTAIPSLSDTYSKQDTEEGSKVAHENKDIMVPKCETKTFQVEPVKNMKDILNNSVTIDKKGIERHKIDNKDKTEKDVCNKLAIGSSSVTAGNSSSQRSEVALPVDQKDPQSSIPAWKKALIAKSQSNNVRNSKNLVNLEQKRKEINLISKSQIPDNSSILSSTNASEESALKTGAELSSKQGKTLLEETKPSAFLTTTNSSDISESKSEEQQQVEESKSTVGDICGSCTPGKLELQSDIAELEAKVEVRETESKGTEEIKSEEAERKVNSFEKTAAENLKCTNLHVNKGKLGENELKSGQPSSADKAKSARAKLEDAKSKFTEKTHIGRTKPTETKMEGSKSKFARTVEMKLDERKLKDSKVEALPSSPAEMPSKMNATQCEINSSCFVNSEAAGSELLPGKLTRLETSPAEEVPKTTKSSITNIASSITSNVGNIMKTAIKPVDNGTTSVRISSAEMMQCTETEVPPTAPNSVEEAKGTENSRVQVSDAETGTLQPKEVEKSEADKSESVGANPKIGKPASVGNKSKSIETTPPQKKATPMKTEVLSQQQSCGTPSVEEDIPCDASAVPEVGPESQPVEEEEEEEDDDDDDETDDDGEDETLATSSSSEDSGFDSISSSVPGIPACCKEVPNSKGIHPITNTKHLPQFCVYTWRILSCKAFTTYIAFSIEM
jgi:hypothetical protein